MRTAPVKIICTAAVILLVETPVSLVAGELEVPKAIVLVVINISFFEGLKFDTNLEDKQIRIGLQQAVDSTHYLPRTVCLGISRQVS